MNEFLFKYYMNLRLSHIILPLNVGIDNVITTLNKIYDRESWTYEIVKEDYNTVQGLYLVTIVLYVPGNVMTGVATININEVGTSDYRFIGVKTAIKNAYDSYVLMDIKPIENISEEKVEEVVKLEDIEEEKIEEPKVEETEPVNLDQLEEEMTKTTTAPVDPLAIRQEQIDFINEFKAKNHIDTDDKFNYCVKTWGENSSYEIYNKRDLIKAGAIVLDEFIAWVKSVQVDNIVNQKVVSPI